MLAALLYKAFGEHEILARLLAAALFTALAVLQKLTVILVAFPMLYVFCLLSGRTFWICSCTLHSSTKS